MSRINRSIYYSFHYNFHLQFLPSIFFEFSPFLHVLNFLLPHSLDSLFSKKFNYSTFFWFSIQFLLSPYFIIRPPTFFKSFPSSFFYSFLLHSFNYFLSFIHSITFFQFQFLLHYFIHSWSMHSFNSFLLHYFIHSFYVLSIPSFYILLNFFPLHSLNPFL